MTAFLTLLIVLILSLVVTRAATIALTATGLSREAARFQARSAFSGAGFTTSESESVVRHPVRRRVIMWLMLAGNAGIIAVIASVVLAAAVPEGDLGAIGRVLAVLAAIGLVWWASRTHWVDVQITRLAAAGLQRWTKLDVNDYAALLHVGADYVVVEFSVRPDSWLAGRALQPLDLREEGVIVLGIELEGGGYLGVPRKDTVFRPGDVLVLYGRASSIEALDQRQAGPAGDAAHEAAAAEQARVEASPRPGAAEPERRADGPDGDD